MFKATAKVRACHLLISLSPSFSAVCQWVGALCGLRVEERAPETGGEFALFAALHPFYFFWPYFLLMGVIVIGSDAVIEMETEDKRCSLKSLRAFSADCSGLNDLQPAPWQCFLRHSVALNLCVFFPVHKLFLFYSSCKYGRGFFLYASYHLHSAFPESVY